MSEVERDSRTLSVQGEKTSKLSDKERHLLDAYWRAANHLSVGRSTRGCRSMTSTTRPKDCPTQRFARAIGRTAPRAEGVAVLGPAPAPIHLVRGRHR